MAYQKTKPLSTDLISTSQVDIQGNFTALATVLDPDNGTALFPRQLHGATTAATTVGLVGRDSVELPGNTALFFLPQAGAAGIDFTTAVKADPGWCKLPCGIILHWGYVAIAQAGTTVPFTPNFPKAVLSVQLSSVATGAQTNVVQVWAPNKTGFTAYSMTVGSHASYQASNAYYLAIGW